MRLVDADLLDRQHAIEKPADPGAIDRRAQHRRRAVRQDRGGESHRLEPAQHLRYFRESSERQIQVHQPVAQRVVGEIQRLQRIIERIAGHLPEIGVPVLRGPQPAVLQLLVAPEGGQPLGLVAEPVATAGGGRGVVEQRAIGVEHAGLDAGKSCVSHPCHSFAMPLFYPALTEPP